MERWVEGSRTQQMKLAKAPWSREKVLRKGAKQALWISFALWTGFTFVGYFTPVTELAVKVGNLATGPWETFWVLFYGGATYFNAGLMREQVCKYMCPYARFQSAMFDKDTLIISYDQERGDPRGTRSRKIDHRAAGLGDCIDCGLCVDVCPTGIDIRNGLQYECIGCAACIDVCNGVMDKMKYPKGLIRYATQNGLTKHLTRGEMLRGVLRPRVLVYTAILVVIVSAFVVSLWLRNPFRVDVVRDRASLARIVDDGLVENVYRLQVMNATERPQRYRIQVSGLAGIRVDGRAEVQVDPAEARWVTVSARVPPEAAAQAGPGAHVIEFRVERVVAEAGEAAVAITEKSTFVVPR
jgi:cytochrome c oxidase accessory protein FixG